MKSYLINENFKTQFKKFVDEGIDKNIVKFYFDQFRKIKDKNANAFKQFNPHMIGFENRNFSDIDVYRTFNELEKVVDYLKGQVDLGEDYSKTSNEGIEKIFENDKLIVLRGLGQNSCINIRQEHGKTASWCVARSKGNMYYQYRNGKNPSTFYFIKNKTKPSIDKYRFFALQVDQYGKLLITSYENDGDKAVTWDELLTIEPELRDLKKYFVFIPLTNLEKEEIAVGEKVSEADYANFDFRIKKRFISSGRKLTDYMFQNTPLILLEDYVKQGNILSNLQEKYLKKVSDKLYEFYRKSLALKIKRSPFLNLFFKHRENLIEIYGDDIEDIRNISFDGEELTIEVNDLDIFLENFYFNFNTYKDYNALSGYGNRYIDNVINKDEAFETFNRLVEENSEAKDLIKKISFIMYGNENEIFNIDKKAWRGVFNILGENDLTSGIYDKIISEYEDLSIDAIENEAKEYFDSISKESIYISVTDDIVGFSSLIKSVIDIENDGITIKSISDLVKRSLPLINPPEYIDYYPYFDYERFENFILETLREETEEIEDEYEENGKFLKKYREIIERDLKYWGFKNGKFENELFKVEVKSNPFEKIIKEKSKVDDPAVHATILNKKTKKETNGVVNISLINNLLSHHEIIENLKKINELI